MRQTRAPPRSTDCRRSSPAEELAAPSVTGEAYKESWIIDTSCFPPCTLPSTRPALRLEVSSPLLSPASISGSRSPFSPSSFSTASSPSPPHQCAVEHSLTAPSECSVDTLPAVNSPSPLPLSLTVDASPVPFTPRSPPCPTDSCAQPSLEAALSNLLSSGLSASRRFSYPPSVHSFTAPSPRGAKAEVAAKEPPVRVTSPALMSPTAASSLFQALDRKRAFRPYQPPLLAKWSFHRVEVRLTVDSMPPLSFRLFQVDGLRERLAPVPVQRGRAVLWAVELDEAMLVVNLQEGGEGASEVRGSGYLSLQSLLDERELRVMVRGDEGGERQWEVRAEVSVVESLRWDDGEERRRLCERLQESEALRRRVEQRQREEKGERAGKAADKGRRKKMGLEGEVKV